MKASLTAAVLAATLATGMAHAKPIEVIGTIPSFDSDVVAKLTATGLFSGVDYVNGSSSTPTLADLQQHSAVLIYTDAGLADPITLGNNLDTFLRGGGGVVVAMFATADGGFGLLNSNFAADFAFDPSPSQDEAQNPTLGTIQLPNDPLVAGVTGFDGGTSGYRNPSVTLNPGAVDVADYSDGTPLIVKTTIGGVETVDLNFYPPSSDARSDFQVASTGGTTILADALCVTGGGGACSAATTPVPEPGTLGVLGMGLAGAALLRRRRA